MSREVVKARSGQAKSLRRPSAPELPGGLFTNRHGYTLRRCDCGTAILLVHERCIVCTINAPAEDEAA